MSGRNQAPPPVNKARMIVASGLFIRYRCTRYWPGNACGTKRIARCRCCKTCANHANALAGQQIASEHCCI